MAKLLEAQIHEETKLWSLIVLCLSRSKYARKEHWRKEKQSEENRGQQLQSSCTLLEHLPKSIFYMLYTISKLRKSRIQRFKSCMIWSWNEEVTAFGRWLLQAEGRIQQSVAKSPFCCGMISQPFCTVLWISLEVSRRDGSQTPQDESQLRSGAEPACWCENISQPSWVSAKSRRHHFSPAKWSLVLPDICDRHFGIFFFRFLCLNFHFLLVFNHSCNSLARKYPRKGKLPSYINSLASTVIKYVI